MVSPNFVIAHREIEVLSHAFTKAVEWGFIHQHPFKGEIRLTGEKPRTRYVEDWEVVECLFLISKRKFGSVLAVQAYIRVKLLTGMLLGDLLRLKISDLKEDGIHFTSGKSQTTMGKRMIIKWSDDSRHSVEVAKEVRPNQSSQFLFCNRDGNRYFNEVTGRAGGWESLWRGFFTRVMDETKVAEKFTEHDLRAKCASDAKTLEHADSKITERVYRRKPEFVEILR